MLKTIYVLRIMEVLIMINKTKIDKELIERKF